MVVTLSRKDDGIGEASFDMPKRRWCELFASVANGEVRALETIYDAASKRLFGLAVWATGSKDDASDVVADVFVKLAEHGERLRSVRDPRAWLLTVTRRLAIDLHRREKRRSPASLEQADLLVAAENDPGRGIDARRASVWLARLPDRQREVVYLRHFADQTFPEIGKITGVPTFTAASRYRLALRRLRRFMEDRS